MCSVPFSVLQSKDVETIWHSLYQIILLGNYGLSAHIIFFHILEQNLDTVKFQ